MTVMMLMMISTMFPFIFYYYINKDLRFHVVRPKCDFLQICPTFLWGCACWYLVLKYIYRK